MSGEKGMGMDGLTILTFLMPSVRRGEGGNKGGEREGEGSGTVRALMWLLQAESGKSAGKQWFNMAAPELTTELKNDLKALQLRNAIDPKQHYKANDSKELPKYFQVSVCACVCTCVCVCVHVHVCVSVHVYKRVYLRTQYMDVPILSNGHIWVSLYMTMYGCVALHAGWSRGGWSCWVLLCTYPTATAKKVFSGGTVCWWRAEKVGTRLQG